MPRRTLFITSLALGLVVSTQAQEDPVMQARARRAAAQGISEGDLPPVPRGIVEPPPLPPPEAHVKDNPRARKAKAKGKGKRGKSGAGKAKAVASKSPAKKKAK